MVNKEALAAMAEVNKMYKDEHLITRLGDNKTMEMKRTVCGVPSIDIPFGGGSPDGRIIELYGKESSGKTTIALHILAAYQKTQPEKSAVFIDFEHAFDKNYASNLGVNIEDLLLSQPMYAEQGLESVEKLITSGGVSVVIIDSVAAMAPKSELEGEMGKASIGVQAKLMSQAMRKLTGAANKTKTLVIFINQEREKIGVMFGNPWVTAGGNALKFYASIRAEIYRGKQTKDSDSITGNRGRIKVVKNKTAPPYQESEFDIEFGSGISVVGSILDYAIELGIIEVKGSWFSMDGTNLGQGRDKVKEVLSENPDLVEKLETIIYEHLFNDN